MDGKRGWWLVALFGALVAGSVAVAEAPASAPPGHRDAYAGKSTGAMPMDRDRAPGMYRDGDVRRLSAHEIRDLTYRRPDVLEKVRERWVTFPADGREMFLAVHPWWHEDLFFLEWDLLTADQQDDFICFFPEFVVDLQSCWEGLTPETRWVFVWEHPGIVARLGWRREWVMVMNMAAVLGLRL